MLAFCTQPTYLLWVTSAQPDMNQGITHMACCLMTSSSQTGESCHTHCTPSLHSLSELATLTLTLLLDLSLQFLRALLAQIAVFFHWIVQIPATHLSYQVHRSDVWLTTRKRARLLQGGVAAQQSPAAKWLGLEVPRLVRAFFETL